LQNAALRLIFFIFLKISLFNSRDPSLRYRCVQGDNALLIHSITTCYPDRREGSREIFRIMLLENTSFHSGLKPLIRDSFFVRVIVLTCFSLFIASGNLSLISFKTNRYLTKSQFCFRLSAPNKI